MLVDKTGSERHGLLPQLDGARVSAASTPGTAAASPHHTMPCAPPPKLSVWNAGALPRSDAHPQTGKVPSSRSADGVPAPIVATIRDFKDFVADTAASCDNVVLAVDFLPIQRIR